MSNGITDSSQDQDEADWLSVSDLMAALMMVFLLIAIIFMEKIELEKDKIVEIAIVYSHLKKELYQDLLNEFSQDFEKWDAELKKDLTVRFNEPKILFDTGKDNLKDKFQHILEDFFPRYVEIITSPKYKDSITDIRIEGHTSSIWRKNTSRDEAYFLNMELSQARTRSTLKFLLTLPHVSHEITWLRKHVTANGLSSSQLILNKEGQEDLKRSQRVEFRIINNAEERIAKILELD